MPNVRKTLPHRTEIDAAIGQINALVTDIAAIRAALRDGAQNPAGLGDGGTAGNVRVTESVVYAIAGARYILDDQDDVWDLSGETDTAALKWRAYALYLEDDGTATFAASAADIDDTGDAAADAASAKAAIPATPADKALIGHVVCPPEVDFDAVGGLASEGVTYEDVVPVIAAATAEAITQVPA